MSSAVRSPRNRLYSRRGDGAMSWSISSPPMRMLRDTTMPPRERTATSVVPPPMSTISEPEGSDTGRPAPIAAAIGSSMSPAQRAPALSAASRTARFSTSVTPEGMPSSIRGRASIPTRSWTLSTKYLIICSVTSKSLITPSRSGRTAMMLAGVRPTIRLASAPTARTRLVLASIATTDGSLITMPRSRTWTSVLAVPRSIPMSREQMPRRRSSMAGRWSSVVDRRLIWCAGASRTGAAPDSETGRTRPLRGSIGQPGKYTRSALADRPRRPSGLSAEPYDPCHEVISRRRDRSIGGQSLHSPIRPVEGDTTVAQRNVRVVPDHEVVEQLDVERAPRGERLRREVQVVGGWRRIAARMVVDEDDPRGIEPDGVAEEFAHSHQRRRHVPLVDRRDAQDVVLGVEHHDPELLAFEPAHLEDEPVGHVARPADRPPGARPVGEESSAELERGLQLGRLRLA